MQSIELKALSRTLNGTRGAVDERAKNLVPCVIYGGKNTHHYSLEPHELKSLIYTSEFKIAKIITPEDTIPVFVKSLQFNPVTDAVSHIDFMELVPGKAVQVEVPVKLEGYAVGVKAGGKLVQRTRKIKIKGSPEDLVNEIKADITNIEVGGTLRIRDINLPKGIVSVSDGAIPVASVNVTRALKEEEKATVAPASAAKAATPAPAAKAAAAPASAAKPASAKPAAKK